MNVQTRCIVIYSDYDNRMLVRLEKATFEINDFIKEKVEMVIENQDKINLLFSIDEQNSIIPKSENKMISICKPFNTSEFVKIGLVGKAA